MILKRTLPFLAALGLVVAPLLTAAPAGAAATVTAVGVGAGWPATFDPTGTSTPTEEAGNYRFSVNGTELSVYCTDYTLPLNPAAAFSVTVNGAAWAGRAANIAAYHASLGTPAVDANDEAAAVQVAIWALTNSITIDALHVPNANVLTRALELAAITATVVVPTALDPVLTVTAVRNGDHVLVSATLSGTDTPAGEPVTITSGSTTVMVTTDAAGLATADLTGVTGSVGAAWNGTVGPGVILTPDDGSQPVITAEAYAVSAYATVEIPAAVTATTAAPGQLPYTGSGTSPWLYLTGAALLGIAVTFVARRSTR